MNWTLLNSKHDQEYPYKGFVIKKEIINTSGGSVLGGRYWKEGGQAINWVAYKNERRVFRGSITPRLKDAKEELDDYLEREQTK